MAAAYAENDDFDRACAWEEKAIELAQDRRKTRRNAESIWNFTGKNVHAARFGSHGNRDYNRLPILSDNKPLAIWQSNKGRSKQWHDVTHSVQFPHCWLWPL